MSLQKLKVREIPKLRESAKDAPHCFSCGMPNAGGTLMLAHANSLRLGRGSYFKTPDYFGAIVCLKCHDEIDGRRSHLSIEEKRNKHRLAHEATLQWWVEEGYLK